MRTTLAYTHAIEEAFTSVMHESARTCHEAGHPAEADALLAMCRQFRIDLLQSRAELGYIVDPDER